MGNYLSFDTTNMYPSKPDSYDSIEQTPETDISSLQSSSLSNCSELLSKIPDDIENEIVFELKIYTDVPQIYNQGGVMQLEYLLKNM